MEGLQENTQDLEIARELRIANEDAEEGRIDGERPTYKPERRGRRSAPVPMYAEFASKYLKDLDQGDLDTAKYPCRKVALLLGYSGSGYSGMQINANIETIELELHKALALSGAVRKDNAFDPQKLSFMRAARTDKGVHALGQVCSLKVRLIPDVAGRINRFLPESIRVWDVLKAANSFHSKNNCDSRVYEYFMPTYAFRSVCGDLLSNESLLREANGQLNMELGEQYIAERLTECSIRSAHEYRIDAETLGRIREAIRLFTGSRNYHSYTPRKPFSDDSAKRHIISLECSDPIVRGGIEWVSFVIHGQSFMLQQIRKMIGILILLIRSNTDKSIIARSFESRRLNIPKAPCDGLLLHRTVFSRYNDRLKTTKSNGLQILFDPYANEIDEFKEKWIYSQIVESEEKNTTYYRWLLLIDFRYSEYSWYLNRDGSVDVDRMPKNLI